MKRCEYCGKELLEEAVMCPACGAHIDKEYFEQEESKTTETAKKPKKDDLLGNSAIVFMVLSCVFFGILTLLGLNGALSLVIPMLVNLGLSGLVMFFQFSFFFYCGLPILWTLPATVQISRKIKLGIPIPKEHKILILIFSSVSAGILLLNRKEENEQ